MLGNTFIKLVVLHLLILSNQFHLILRQSWEILAIYVVSIIHTLTPIHFILYVCTTNVLQCVQINKNLFSRKSTRPNQLWSPDSNGISCQSTTGAGGPFSFTQFTLEEDEGENCHFAKLRTPPMLSDYEFTPILLWKPSSAAKQQKKVQSSGGKEQQSSTEEKKINKMNLTDNLPIRPTETKHHEVRRISL